MNNADNEWLGSSFEKCARPLCFQELGCVLNWTLRMRQQNCGGEMRRACSNLERWNWILLEASYLAFNVRVELLHFNRSRFRYPSHQHKVHRKPRHNADGLLRRAIRGFRQDNIFKKWKRFGFGLLRLCYWGCILFWRYPFQPNSRLFHQSDWLQ